MYAAEAPCRLVECTAVQERLGRTRAASSSMTAAGSASSHHRSQRRRPLPAAPPPPSAVASLLAPSRCAAAAAASMSCSGRLATWTLLHWYQPAAAPLRGCKRVPNTTVRANPPIGRQAAAQHTCRKLVVSLASRAEIVWPSAPSPAAAARPFCCSQWINYGTAAPSHSAYHAHDDAKNMMMQCPNGGGGSNA
jgi:hypothetical protein